ncbi:MAG: acetylglutamate kinase [Anaerolineales bacterium]|nr:acetylglutamate kinase [Anaerolineales bacterium]MCB9128692.1 acetylglutamate kinase [Ardenticatenales bacterium]MCB9172602.1 acetylglutamate kinase [Ardenticatenales bacterium]
MLTLKLSGESLDDRAALARFAAAVAAINGPTVIVHGGGRGTTTLMARLGIVPRFVEGLRVTDEATLAVAVMGMVGEASSQLVQALVGAGLPALGLSGVDAALVTAQRRDSGGNALGAVGDPSHVNVDAIRALQRAGFLPCLAPICRAPNGELLNVNADGVAAAVAAALKADSLLLVTNVRAVKINGHGVPSLGPDAVRAAIASGEIRDGMIPKCRYALAALRDGVAQVIITDLAGLEAFVAGEIRGTVLRGDASS